MKPSFALTALYAVAVSLLALSCGGDSDEPLFDPTRADELTHAALIAPDDLPGPFWTITGEDNFDEIEVSVLRAHEACGPLVSWRESAAGTAERIAGKAKREMEQQAGANAEVQVEITAYDGDSGLEDLLEEWKGLVSDGSLLACLSEVLPAVRNNAQITLTASAPSTEAPAGGAAYADDRSLPSPGGPVMLHAEWYIWVMGNVVIELEVYGPEARFDPELPRQAIEKLSAAVEEASEAQ